MTVKDRSVFVGLLTVMAQTFGAKLSDPQVEIYWDVLGHLSIDQFRKACGLWLAEGKRFPVPAQLLEQVTGNVEDRAASAWAALFEAAKRIDAYKPLAVADPALAYAFKAMFSSWPNFCSMDLSPEMWAAKRKEFVQLYRAGLHRRTEGESVFLGIFNGETEGLIGMDHSVKLIPAGSMIATRGGDHVESQ